MWVLGFMVHGSLQSKAAEPSARFTVDEKVEKEEWMPWEPDEKEGRYILAQVMEGGNFGQYMKGYRPGLKWNYVWNVCRRNMHLLRWYPSEALWAPVWIVWHKLWKIRKRWQMRRTLIVKGNR